MSSDDTEGLLESQRHGDGQASSSVIVQEPADKAWAVAFIINVAITFFSAIYYSRSAWPALVGGVHGGLEMAIVEGMLIVPSVFAVSGILLRAMIHCPKLMLQIAAGGTALLCVGEVVSVLDTGKVTITTGLAIFGALITWLVIRRRGTMKFAASNLKAAALAVTSTPKMMWWGLFMVTVRAIWFVAVVMAIPGSWADLSFDGNVTPAAWVMLHPLWSLSMVWQFTVIGNVVAATVASSVASWSSSPDNVEPVWDSFCRVSQSSLGPLSKAGMIEGVLRIMFVLLSAFSTEAGSSFFCVRFVVNYVLLYTVFIIGVYKLGFAEGPRGVRGSSRWPPSRRRVQSVA